MKKLEKKKTETLLEFANRFGVAASRYIEAQLPSRVQAKLLYSKLPKELQKQLAILNFEECTLPKLVARIRNYLDWMSVSDQKAWTGQVHDYMDIDAVEQVMEEQRIKKYKKRK